MSSRDNIPDSDRKLLSRWAARGDETAFHALVERYAGLVYGVAIRRSGNRALAEEAAQNVFALLARKAAGLASHPSLAAWLHRAALLESAHLLRRETAHSRRVAAFAEHTAVMNFTTDFSESSEPPPGLDEALARLSEPDRVLLLRRFFHDLSYREIAEAERCNEAAVRKRLERALARLASHLKKGGSAVSPAALTGSLQAALPHAAPPGFAATVSAAALSAAPTLTAFQLLLHPLQLMIHGKTLTLTGASLLLLLAFGGSHLAARHYSATPGNSSAAAALEAETARSSALSGHRLTPSGAPGDSPQRARLRSMMRLISKSVRVDMAQRSVSLAGMDPSLAGGAAGLRAMADFKEEDLAEAWRLLPDFRGEPKDFEGLAAFLADMRAANEPPRAVLDALLAENLRVDGKPPLYAIYETVGLWFEKDPPAAWRWLREAAEKGDFPFNPHKPFGGDFFAKWLEEDPAAALAALSSSPPEWNAFAREALETSLKHFDSRFDRSEVFWPELKEAADDRAALLTAECAVERSRWAREDLLPWLLTRNWQNGVNPERVVHAWTWRDGELDEARFGMVCESLDRLPTEEANRAVSKAVREVFADIPAESRDALLEKLVKDPSRRARVVKEIQP